MWISVLKQMWNRRRGNTWIGLELLFVFCLTWYIVDFLFVYNYNLNIPNYRNIENTLQINLAELPEEHPEFRKEESKGEALEANYQRILQIIKDYQGIEEIGVSYNRATPGSGNYWGMSLGRKNDSTVYAGGQRIAIAPSEDFFKVFGYSTNNGKELVSVKDFDWGVPRGIVIGRDVEQKLFPNGSAIGKELEVWKNPDEHYIVIGVVDDIKRFDYDRPQGSYYIANTIKENNISIAEISIRHTASLSTKVFRDKFKEEMSDRLRIGNFYLLSVIPYSKIAADTKQGFGVTNEIKLRVYLMIFFLLNILLCVMGTFWYRINLRPNEIGLRKAVGSTSNSIRNILLMEGFWLLFIIVIPAMLIEYQFVHTDIIETVGRGRSINPEYLPDRTFQRFLLTNGITFIFMGIVVSLAILLPALKGASLAPAEALHHE